MKIGFIGAGKVGTTFGLYLRDRNIEITGYYDRNHDSARSSAKTVNAKGYDNLYDLVRDADVIGITTNDDNIKSVAEEILKLDLNGNLNLESKEFFHMSGSLGIGVLERLSKKCLTIHPLQAFSSVEKAILDLPDTVLTVTGNLETEMGSVIKTLKNQIIEIRESDKTKYHAAACVASNYLVTVIDTAVSMLKEAGFSEELATKAIIPLVSATVTNIENMGCAKALTGPIARGDADTVRNHLEVLEDSSFIEVYKLLGEKTVELARRDGLKDETKLDLIKGLLTGEVQDER
jgi:predicted short-subunit dehydrogenase-like oxidoreductase (DUF2520 family)